MFTKIFKDFHDTRNASCKCMPQAARVRPQRKTTRAAQAWKIKIIVTAVTLRLRNIPLQGDQLISCNRQSSPPPLQHPSASGWLCSYLQYHFIFFWPLYPRRGHNSFAQKFDTFAANHLTLDQQPQKQPCFHYPLILHFGKKTQDTRFQFI